MVNVTDVQHARYQNHSDAARHAELRPEVNAGALTPNNTFVAGTPNESIDRVWGREAALLSNNPVLPKFRNCGYKREAVAAVGVVSFSSVPCWASTVPFPMTPPCVGGASSFLNPSPDPLTLVATYLACPDRA